MENGELIMDCLSHSYLSRFRGSSMHQAGRVSVQGFELEPGSARILACLVSGDRRSAKAKHARMRALPGDHPCIRLAASASGVLNWSLGAHASLRAWFPAIGA